MLRPCRHAVSIRADAAFSCCRYDTAPRATMTSPPLRLHLLRYDVFAAITPLATLPFDSSICWRDSSSAQEKRALRAAGVGVRAVRRQHAALTARIRCARVMCARSMRACCALPRMPRYARGARLITFTSLRRCFHALLLMLRHAMLPCFTFC